MKKVYFPGILTQKVNANGGKKVYFCEENLKSHFAYRSLPVNQMSWISVCGASITNRTICVCLYVDRNLGFGFGQTKSNSFEIYSYQA